MYTERQDDRYGGRVPSKKRKAKEAILKSVLSLIVYIVRILYRPLCKVFSATECCIHLKSQTNV